MEELAHSVRVNQFSWTMTTKTAGVGVGFASEINQFVLRTAHKSSLTNNNKLQQHSFALSSSCLLNKLSFLCYHTLSLLPAREEHLRDRQEAPKEAFSEAHGGHLSEEDSDSEEEEPQPKKRSTSSKSSKSGKQKKKRKDIHSDNQDSDQSPKRRQPLSEIFHQERHDNRIANHPSTKMPTITR